MSKSTKSKPKPLHSMQRFNRTEQVRSITIGGVESLADVKRDKEGHVTLVLKRDGTKIDTVNNLSDLLVVTKKGTTLEIDLDKTKLKNFALYSLRDEVNAIKQRLENIERN